MWFNHTLYSGVCVYSVGIQGQNGVRIEGFEANIEGFWDTFGSICTVF